MLRKTPDWRSWCSSLMVGSVLISCLQEHTFAQITPDNTLPNNSSVARDGNTFNITGGTQAGSNLFHSFSEFSVPTGGTASFNNALDIQNIITRVTGGSISNINGLIRANGTANLFLLNPNGIIFGANARLDIGGSFLATTASSFKWNDGSTFSATNPQPPSELLAINPSALFFNQLQAARIENKSTSDAGNNLKGLRVPDGRSLLLVGGDIVLDGGSLNALGGLVELAGVSGNGTVGLNVDSQDLSLSVPNGVPTADISLSNGAVVDVSAGGGGSITVNARNLDLKQESQLVAGIKSGLGTATATAGDIKINATDTVALDNSSVSNIVEKDGRGKARDVSITTGSLEVTNGARLSASTFGKGDAGSVSIFARDAIKFDGEGSKYEFDSGAYSEVKPGAEGNAGGVLIRTGSLEVTNGAVLSASTVGKGDAGIVNIFARDAIKFDGEANNRSDSGAYSRVNSGAEGNAGGVLIRTGSLEVTNGALLSASTFGKGDAGSVTIKATDAVKFDGEGKDRFNSGAYSRVVNSGTEGNAGGVLIRTGSLEVTNGARLDASTEGKGDAGIVNIFAKDAIKFDGEGSKYEFDSGAFSEVKPGAEGNAGGVLIRTGSLEVINGAQLSASTFGKGDAGSVSIFARDAIKFDGEGSKYEFDSGAYSEVKPGAEGNAGGVLIRTGSLEVTNGAVLSASTVGKGDAGIVNIFARDAIKFDGEANNRSDSGAYSRVNSGAEGNAGGVLIRTGSLEVTNGALLSASTFGKGDAGSVTIKATDAVKFDGEGKDGFDSGAYSRVFYGAEGNAKGVSINTGSLEVTNGAVLDASTLGKGNAGIVTIEATDAIKFDGEGAYDGGTYSPVNSGVYSRVISGAQGNAGGILIKTGSLAVTNGAELNASTEGKGNAGIIDITANTFEASNGGQVSTKTSGESDAGNIIFKIKNNITLSGSKTGLFASTSEGSIGNGGNIIIDPRIITIRDGAAIAVDSQGEGTGGDIQLTAGFLTLDRGTISAATRSNTGGNITLNLQELLLRDRSQITSTAGIEQFGGNGGNITINAPNGFILAVPSENSDITANAFTGNGGRVDIQATGIYGIEFRDKENPQTSDITASSVFSTQGTVELITPEIDPNSGLVELPTIPVDTKVAQTCYSPDYAQNRFVITGRGGLPPNPQDILTPDMPQIDWVSVKPTHNNRSIPPVTTSKPTTSTPKRIIEATGATLNAKGKIVLSANSSAAPYTFRHNPIQCHGS